MPSSTSFPTNTYKSMPQIYGYIFSSYLRHTRAVCTCLQSALLSQANRMSYFYIYFAVLCIACCLILLESAPHKDVHDLNEELIRMASGHR